MRQLQEVQSNPVEGITVTPTDTLQELSLELKGPEETPFAGATFYVTMIFDDQYPTMPPKAFFRTKIFHPNISERGEVCVNTLKRDWTPDLGIRHVLAVLRCLLIEPNPESALNEEAGRLLLEDYKEYFKRAQLFAAIHAGAADHVSTILRDVENNTTQAASQVPSTSVDKKSADRKKALKRL